MVKKFFTLLPSLSLITNECSQTKSFLLHLNPTEQTAEEKEENEMKNEIEDLQFGMSTEIDKKGDDAHIELQSPTTTPHSFQL